MAMGMIPILWTRTPSAGKFDTNGATMLFHLAAVDFLIFFSFLVDWRVADGTVTGNQSVATFQAILTNASTIDTGYVPVDRLYIYLF